MAERHRAVAGVGALAAWLAVTAAWWALALWPLPETAPEWLARTRSVCFNTAETGLPDASGWLVLIGQPIGVLAVLMVVWGPSVSRGLRLLSQARAGRALLGLAVAGVLLGLAAAWTRVTSEWERSAAWFPAPGEVPPETYPKLDREAPPLHLVDQRGEALDGAQLRGRPVLVTFAFGNCETICPLVVRDTLRAQARQRERVAAGEAPPETVPRVVVVTLDPWRDTPSRLGHVAAHWEFGDDAFFLSGAVTAVNAALDAWNVVRRRDPDTGEVIHPPLVYVLDATGRIAYASSGGVEALVELIDRTRRPRDARDLGNGSGGVTSVIPDRPRAVFT